MRTRAFRTGIAAGLLSGVLGLTAYAESQLTFCQPVEDYATVTHGFFVLDVCPTLDPPPAPDGDGSTPRGDPAQCWTFVHPTNPYDELPPMVFRLPAAPTPGPDAAALVVPTPEPPTE